MNWIIGATEGMVLLFATVSTNVNNSYSLDDLIGLSYSNFDKRGIKAIVDDIRNSNFSTPLINSYIDTDPRSHNILPLRFQWNLYS